MRGQLRFYLVVLVCLLVRPASAALDGVSRIGADIKLFRSASSTVMLYGWRFLYNPSEAFSIGGAGFTGQMTGSSTGSYSYGGLSAAFNLSLTHTTRLEFGLIAGGGGGFDNSNNQSGGIVVEPTLSVAFGLGKNVGAALQGGFLWMPTSSAFTGFTVGLRFEFFADRAPTAALPGVNTVPRPMVPVAPSANPNPNTSNQ